MLNQAVNANKASAPSLIFTDCELVNAAKEAQAQAQSTGAASSGSAATAAPRRREVIVGGRRVKTIDVHAHCVVPETLAMSGMRITRYGHFTAEDQPGGDVTREDEKGLADVGRRRIAEMDAAGIDVEALSINPLWYKCDRDRAAEIVRINNDRLAEYCANYPERFVAYASVALQFPDLAVQQIEHAVKKLGLRGAAVGASCAGDEFSDPKFHPFWAKCEELGILVFIHPQSTPELANRFKGNGWLANTIGNPLDTTICLSHLIFEGTLDRFPGLKICSAHGGGFLPSYAARSDHACRVGPDGCNPAIQLKKKPTEYLRDMYFDTLVFTPEALRHLAAEVGSSQIVIGTDHPIPWYQDPVTHIMETPGFTDEERIAMLGGTAARLLKIG